MFEALNHKIKDALQPVLSCFGSQFLNFKLNPNAQNTAIYISKDFYSIHFFVHGVSSPIEPKYCYS